MLGTSFSERAKSVLGVRWGWGKRWAQLDMEKGSIASLSPSTLRGILSRWPPSSPAHLSSARQEQYLFLKQKQGYPIHQASHPLCMSCSVSRVRISTLTPSHCHKELLWKAGQYQAHLCMCSEPGFRGTAQLSGSNHRGLAQGPT